MTGTAEHANRIYSATVTAPVNIAVIKYWGKRSTSLNLPTNSSLSITLSQNDLCALTTAAASPSFSRTQLWLNGVEQPVSTNARLNACLDNLRQLRADLERRDSTLVTLSKYHLHISSENNFPTAAGLASSAAGFAALVRAIGDLYELQRSPSDLSRIARQGSGSACRSMLGGYVSWEMGEMPDGSDSLAQEVAPRSHWPEMRAVILVVSADKKGVSSTSGMQRTVATSALFAYRVKQTVPERMIAMKKAIQERDFATFADLTMRDSNQFHAVCLDSSPPIFYLNDVSRGIIVLIEELNRLFGRPVVAYTFDAGPNAVIYFLEENEKLIFALLRLCFADVQGMGDILDQRNAGDLPEGFDTSLIKSVVGGVSRVILTEVGEGPQRVEKKSLLDENGLPF